MSSIARRPNGAWRARYRDANGKEHAVHRATRREAQAWLDEKTADRVNGTQVDPAAGRITVAEWVVIYQENTPKRATTAERDTVVLNKWWIPALGGVRLDAVTPTAVRTVVNRMAEALAPATVRTNYAVFKAVMSAAVEADRLTRTPCRGVRLPPENRDEIRFLSMDELHSLASEMPEPYRATVYVAGVLGLRWSEVAGLRVGRIDFLRRTAAVVETLAEVNGRHVVADVKTRASKRTLTVPAGVLDALADHLARRERPGPDEYVFVAPDGGPLRATNFRRRVWNPAVQRAGLDGLTFHGLRHSAVGFMIELGAHPRVIQQRMGHSSIRTTMDRYGSVLPAVDLAVTNGLDELLASSRGLIADSGRTRDLSR